MEFVGKHGKLKFCYEEFPENCGMCVISDLRRISKKTGMQMNRAISKKLAEEFTEYLRTTPWLGEGYGKTLLTERVIVATDVVSDKRNRRIHELCTLGGWNVCTDPVTNVNSGNKIQMFSLVRDIDACKKAREM